MGVDPIEFCGSHLHPSATHISGGHPVCPRYYLQENSVGFPGSPVYWTVGLSPLGVGLTGSAMFRRNGARAPRGAKGGMPPPLSLPHKTISVTPTRRPSVFSSSGRPSVAPHPAFGLLPRTFGAHAPAPKTLRVFSCSCRSGSRTLRPVALRTFGAQTPSPSGKSFPPQAGAVRGDRRRFGEPELEHQRCEADGNPCMGLSGVSKDSTLRDCVQICKL